MTDYDTLTSPRDPRALRPYDHTRRHLVPDELRQAKELHQQARHDLDRARDRLAYAREIGTGVESAEQAVRDARQIADDTYRDYALIRRRVYGSGAAI